MEITHKKEEEIENKKLEELFTEEINKNLIDDLENELSIKKKNINKKINSFNYKEIINLNDIKIIDNNTIHNSIKKLIQSYYKINTIKNKCNFFDGFINLLNEFKYIFYTIENNTDILITIKNIRTIFYDIIIKYKKHKYIYHYNNIFNDGIFNNIKITDIEIDTQQKKNILKNYEDKEKEIEKLLNEKEKKEIENNKFKKGEIIGAKDKEGNWWLSEILDIIIYDNINIYIIDFKGWSKIHREVITKKSRLQKFNPYKHKLFKT